MGIKLTNNAFATLAAGINSAATSITLTTGQGARFPTLAGGDYFYATLVDTSNNLEIVKCTARSTDVLTVVRGQESTTARAYVTGDRIEIRLTAQTFIDAVNEIGPTQVSDELNSSTGYFDLPSGTTAERPGSPGTGMIRHNSTTGYPEWYDGTNWQDIRPSTYFVEYLVIAGGGGGGAARSSVSYASGGGGGAGGYRSSVAGQSSGGGGSAESQFLATQATMYTVTVGAGGAGGAPGVDSGTNGANSVFATITSVGGGAGSGYPVAGVAGGSGGGAGGAAGTQPGGAGTSNQGYAGGNGLNAPNYGAGGGGGAGAVGGNGTTNVGGNGGAGVSSNITGSAVTRAGGGGGGVYTSGGTPGLGGSGGGVMLVKHSQAMV